MFYQLSILFTSSFSWLNVVRYVSFRAAAALFTAFVVTCLSGSAYIRFSQRFFRAKAREYTPESHQAKNDIPTMGGVLIAATSSVSILLWTHWSNGPVWLLLGALCGFGLLGAIDDWSKISRGKGISERTKFWYQLLIAICCAVALVFLCFWDTNIYIPFFKNSAVHSGYLFIAWAVFIMVGTSNAVNLTDGLDGLAISSLVMNFATFGIIAYLAGHTSFSHYLMIPHTDTAEIAIVAAALIGASLGFLWYNAYPAQMFMGDVGALSLGGVLGLMALMTKQELLLAISGGLFVAETISVMIQVFIYKRFKIRIFRMAPLHHHFELVGWQEPKIVVRFGIITFLLCLLALLTLKLR